MIKNKKVFHSEQLWIVMIIKNMENEILFALAFGPILFLLKDHISGFIELNDEQ